MPRRKNPETEFLTEADIAELTPDERRWLDKLHDVRPIGDPPPGMTEEEYFAPKPYKPYDWDSPNITDKFEYETMPEGFPRFRILHAPRSEWQNDKQYEAGRRDEEGFYYFLGLFLGLSQLAATCIGLHRTCPHQACRRARQCVSRRAEDDWTVFPGPMMPPCCNNIERTERVRHMVNIKIEQHNERVQAEQAEAGEGGGR